jgi:hypothetical protein
MISIGQCEELAMERVSRLSLFWLTCLGSFFVSVAHANDKPAFDEASLEFFEKEVRPILVSRCLECHSSGKGTPRGGLRLDSRDAIFQGGDTGPAVTSDNPQSSLFLSAINYGDVYQMPPKSKLPAHEIAILTRWVESGLPWPKEASAAAGTVKPFDLAARAAGHWCWQPLGNEVPPTITRVDWPLEDADRFILAKLEAKGLAPAPPADKRALLRRVYFDLIGLPPSPDEVEQFAADESPRAWEQVADKLLDSARFGERWARHWLDLTRYAETRGHEFEPVIPNAWQYRDYVIRALNADVPYDRFVTEHLAGDLIDPRWRESANPPINESPLGTGFWMLGEEVHSPVDIRKDETDRMDNRLDVMSKTFLGLTVACARCHDHKFDAISQRDYYALAGFAISGGYQQIRIDTCDQHRQIAIELESLRSEARRELAKTIIASTQSVLDKLDLYLLAAREAIDEGLAIPESAAGEQSLPEATQRRVSDLANKKQLDAILLSRWCIEMNLAKRDVHHPLHGLFAAGPAVASSERTGFTQGLVVDFGDPGSSLPFQNGVSFGLRPITRGRLMIGGTPEQPEVRVAGIGGWERDLFWKNIRLAPGTEVDNGTLGTWQPYGRMVRSPEFTLTSRNLWYLVRGSVRAYAAVNSHLIVVGPLHGSVLREFKQADDQWRWVQQDMSLYPGHRLHIEFSPADEGACSIAMVVQSDDPPKLPEQGWPQWGSSTSASPQQRAAAYQHAFRDATVLLTAENIHPSSPDRSAAVRDARSTIMPGDPRARLADWFVGHESLFTRDRLDVGKALSSHPEATLAKQVRWESTLAPTMLEGNGVNEYLLVRGNSSTPKEPVPRRFLEAFGQNSPPVPYEGSGRLQLAREVLRSPLAARVAVNRVWHHLFGRGIVPSVDNMGVLGLPPSHPELLDYLATRFVREGWSTKALIRSLVLTQTYRMSSHPTDADPLDPNNDLWHRMPMKRLEGEAIRDSLLAVSGRLDRTLFGPSVPIHLTEFMQGRGRPGASGPLDGLGRRSIYIAVRRNFLSPMMLAFDTPSPFSTVGRRTVSNVPAQALIMMNDPFVIEQARLWADRLLADPSKTPEQRLDLLYLTAFARPALPAEKSEALDFLRSQTADQPENQHDAWSNLCHVMFNIKEFVFVE